VGAAPQGMEAARREPLNRQRGRHPLDAASLRSDGLTELSTDAYEYLLLLHAADEELKSGTDPGRIRETADRLRAVSPEHVLVRLLDAKAARAKVVQGLLRDGVRKRGVPKTPKRPSKP
jgi:hypothetical protein